jgi:CDP-glucose 4,6-dehydratase
VLEPLSGYLWLGARLFSNNTLPGLPLDKEAFNFGPAADVNNTVAEVADALAGHWPDFSSVMDRTGCAGHKECTLLKLSCDKALAHLNWKAALNFHETIAYTAEWYKAYYGGTTDMFSLTMNQIVDYVQKAGSRGNSWAQ